MKPIIDISAVDFAFDKTPVLSNISLQIQPGSTLGIVGPNGGGKTTLLKLILGLLSPQRGSITVADLPPKTALRRGDIIGYLPQSPRISENFPISVAQLIRTGLAGKTGLLHSYRRDDLAFVQGLIQTMQLEDVADKPIGTISGGLLQRVLIARAVAPRPRVLILDEPTTGIDKRAQQRFTDLLQQLKSELGLTLLLVSHDLRAVTAVADRIACLDQTVHFHDVPERMPPELVYRMFACDLEAAGIVNSCQQDHARCSHGHDHLSVSPAQTPAS
jgi:zinc transport system ATP-binding protein